MQSLNHFRLIKANESVVLETYAKNRNELHQVSKIKLCQQHNPCQQHTNSCQQCVKSCKRHASNKLNMSEVFEPNKTISTFELTGYLSSKSTSRASPKIVRQQFAIFSCCFTLKARLYHIIKPTVRETKCVYELNIMDVSYESTWFSKESTTGYLDVLKALSAIASITSCHEERT